MEKIKKCLTMKSSKCNQELMDSIKQQQINVQELTSDLIKIPTENPPVNNYREKCEFRKARLKKNDFQTELIRAEGILGDSNKFLKWNLVARHDNGKRGECIHFNSHTDVIEEGNG